MRALGLLGALCLLRGLLAAPRLSSGVSLMTHPSEERYSKYAVALAATEPLRAERNRAVRSIVGPLKWGELRVLRSRSNVCDPRLCGGRADGRGVAWQRTCSGYIAQSSKVIRASGLTVAEYNALGRELARPGPAAAAMRRRVLHQAYLYRLAAVVNGAPTEAMIPSPATSGGHGGRAPAPHRVDQRDHLP